MKIRTPSKSNKGFTLGEMLAVVFVIFAIVVVLFVGVYSSLLAGNFWFTEEGVLKEIRLSEPKAQRVLTSQRGVWGDSEILVELEGGGRKTFLLESNALFNYEIEPK